MRPDTDMSQDNILFGSPFDEARYKKGIPRSCYRATPLTTLKSYSNAVSLATLNSLMLVIRLRLERRG